MWVRRAGENEPRAEFSYRLRAPDGGRGTLRIEEAGAEDSRYDVLVDGLRVHTRGPAPEQRGTYGGQVGLVHYDIDLPKLRRATFKLTFRNAAKPGPGARIAGVWVQGAKGDPQAPYGGTVENAQALTGSHGATELRTDLFGRPYAIYDFGREVGGTVSVRAKRLSGAPRLAFAFSESEQFMTSASDFSADPVGVVDETQTVKVARGRDHAEGAAAARRLPLPDALPRRAAAPYASPTCSCTSPPPRCRPTCAPTRAPSCPPTTSSTGSGTPGRTRSRCRRSTPRPAAATRPSRVPPTTTPRSPTARARSSTPPSATASSGAATSPWPTPSPTSPRATRRARRRPSSGWRRSRTPTGEPAGVYLPLPGDAGWNYGWGEYAAWWMVNYETHYRYTGDKAFLDRWFDQLQGAVGWFESHTGADGLFDVPGDAGGHWGYANSGKESYDNALYVYALAHAARAAEAEGRADLAATGAPRPPARPARINATLYDGTAYVVAADDARHAQDGNAMALLAGVATGDRAAAVRRFLAGLNGPFGPLTVDAPGGAVPQYMSPFITSFQLATARHRHGDRPAAPYVVADAAR